MMNKRRCRIISAFLTAVFAAASLTSCNTNEDTAYWEDTLPTAASTTTSASVQIITEDTKPPISIDMPATTTVPTTRDTELATTTETVTPASTTTVTTVPSVTTEPTISTVSGVPTVLSTNFTSTTAPEPTETTEEPTTTAAASENSAQVTELSDGTITHNDVSELDGSGVVTMPGGTTLPSSDTSSATVSAAVSQGDAPYIFNDPISTPYAYSSLTGDKKKVYDILVEALKNHESKVTFPSTIKITSADYCDIYQQIYNTEHNIFYIDTQMKYTTNVKTQNIVSAELCYIYTQDEVKTMQKKIDEKADAIIKKIDDNMSQYSIVKLFFDELVKGCVYDIEAVNCRDIYGCLVNGRAVCGGYAKAFSYLCDKVGIQSLTITGDFDAVPHMWNMVNIGDEWYHIDVTAGVVTNAITDYIRYDYFCVDDALVGSTHTVYEQTYTYPEAKASKYNYYAYNGLVADSVEKAVELIRSGIVSAAEKGECVIQISCTTAEVFDKVVFALFDKSQAQALTIYDEVYDLAVKKYNRESIVYNQEKNTRVIKLFLEYLD